MKALLIVLFKNAPMVHYTSQLANALSKKLETVVIAPVGLDKKFFNENIKIIQLPLGDTRNNMIINTLIISRPITFIKTIYQECPDIIHCVDSHFWLSLLLIFLARFPIVTTIHDVHSHIGDSKIGNIIEKTLHVKFSKYIIVHGCRAQHELGKNVKSAVISHGDYSFFLNYKNDLVEEENGTVLFFGRIKDYKGLDYLIMAFNKIITKYPEARLIIAGQGSLDKYKNLIRDDSSFEIHNDYIPDEEVARLFQRATMVVLPYIDATQSGVIPIAFAFKKPVIATNTGDIPEVIHDNVTGILVQPKDVDALVEAMSRLMINRELREIIALNAYKKMEEDLSWDAIADKTVDVYEKVVNRSL